MSCDQFRLAGSVGESYQPSTPLASKGLLKARDISAQVGKRRSVTVPVSWGLSAILKPALANTNSRELNRKLTGRLGRVRQYSQE